jgi:hypothetical protein
MTLPSAKRLEPSVARTSPIRFIPSLISKVL